jgi:hypothetical protein
MIHGALESAQAVVRDLLLWAIVHDEVGAMFLETIAIHRGR